MLLTLSCQVKNLLLFILLLKAHAQPPFVSTQHKIKNELHQHYQHHSNQKQQENLLYSTLVIAHPKGVKAVTGKTSSVPLITFDMQKLKYPDNEKSNSKGIEFLTNCKNLNSGSATDQNRIHKNIQNYHNQPSSLKAIMKLQEAENLTSRELTKQLKHSHQQKQKREVILADVPVLSLQLPSVIDSDTDSDTVSSNETTEDEVKPIFSPSEISFLKTYQEQKGSSSSSSTPKFSQSFNIPYNKVVIGFQDIDGGESNKKMKFNLLSYPYHDDKFKVAKKFSSNLYNSDVEDIEDYDAKSNYDNDNNKDNKINNQYSNNLNDDRIDELRFIFNDKRMTAPPVWMKMLRNRKDGRKPWTLVDQKQEDYFNKPDLKARGISGFKRQKLKVQRTQFVPSISVGAMTNLGDFFDHLKSNVDFIEKGRFNPDAIDIMEGDHLSKMTENLKSEAIENNQSKPTGTAAFLHAIRTYRPSQKVRSLVSMTPEGYHGHGAHFSDPNYMWMGLGK